MANELEVIAADLFNKIRSRFENVEIGDQDAAVINDPQDARFFDFDFDHENETYGHVTLSLADPATLKCYFSSSLLDTIKETGGSKQVWYDFLQELRMFAKKRLLNFDPRDISKSNLTQKDFKHISTVDVEDDEDDNDMNELMNTNESIGRPRRTSDSTSCPHCGDLTSYDRSTGYCGFCDQYDSDHPNNWDDDQPMERTGKLDEASLSKMYGSSKRSYQALESTRVLVKHKTPVDEEKRGARSRQIESIFVENGFGERFKMPINHLGGARAMARHVSNGGNLYDQIGESIVGMCETIQNIKEFNKYVRQNHLVSESTDSVIKTVKEEYDALRNQIGSLKTQRGYSRFAENFVPGSLTEGDTDITEIKNKFASPNYSDVIESILPKIARMMENKENYEHEEDLNDKSVIVVEWLRLNEPMVLMHDKEHDNFMKNTEFTDKNKYKALVMDDIAQRIMIPGFTTQNFHEPSIEDPRFKDGRMTKERMKKNIKASYSDIISSWAGKMSTEFGNIGASGAEWGENTRDRWGNISADSNKNSAFNDMKRRNRSIAKHLIDRYETALENMDLEPGLTPEYRVNRVPETSTIIKESALFEKAISRVFEGTWHWPTNEDEYREIAELLSQPLPVGIDAVNATGALYNLLGDDNLFDELGELADREGEDANASPLVMSWLEDEDRIVYASVQGAINSIQDDGGLGAEDQMMMDPTMDSAMDPTMDPSLDPTLAPPELPDEELVEPINPEMQDPNAAPLPQEEPLVQSGHSKDDALLEDIMRLAGQKKRIRY